VVDRALQDQVFVGWWNERVKKVQNHVLAGCGNIAREKVKGAPLVVVVTQLRLRKVW
jgi:hypothetical protein